MEGMNYSLTDLVRVAYGLRQQDIRTYSPLTLAYIGDAIYDLIIRTMSTAITSAGATRNLLPRQKTPPSRSTA